jgi:Domain of unknown function (DUF4397)
MGNRLVRTTIGVIGLLLAGIGVTAPASDAGQASGAVFVVQAMPGASFTVAIDGDEVEADTSAGQVLGPYDLAPGDHDVSFTDVAGGAATDTSVSVTGGSSMDVVLHRPAATNGDPVVSVYAAPRKPIGPGKARVLLAHTATVPPADVRVDGKTVFTNIANGEYAEADLPGGTHQAALLPTGSKGDPILGPLDVSLPAGTITMVYAVGNPQNGSMNVIAHRQSLASDGTVAPQRIETGSGGLVADLRVATFGKP